MHSYKINEDLAQETGIHTGDGSMNIYSGVHYYTLACHHINDKEYMDNCVIPLYHKIYGIKLKARIWSKGSYGFRIHNKEVVEFKNKILNLPLGKKNNIEIPKQIINNKNYQKAFLRGFISTDGSINTFLANKKDIYPRIEMCNVSKNLMNQINRILKNFGFKTSAWLINKNHPSWQEDIRLTVNGFKMLKKWNDLIGFNNPKQIRKLKQLGIKE